MALLHAMTVLATELRLSVVAGHVNHQLRGAESDGDERFLVAWAGEHGVSLQLARVDPAAASGRHSNLEAAARELRYEALAALARSAGAADVLTGHTADDQAETLLHRLLRGSGLRGLCGMSRARRLAEGLRLVRPLLSTTREEVLDYLHAASVPFRQDSSNTDLRLTRNRIRHGLLPQLRLEYNPRVVPLLTGLAEQVQEHYAHVRRQSAALLRRVEHPRAGEVIVLDADALSRASAEIACEALRQVWRREGWPLRDMGRGHWRRLYNVAAGRAAAVQLPGSLVARRVGPVLQLRRS
jgi:tRNA(Ile)-lysidine synthase